MFSRRSRSQNNQQQPPPQQPRAPQQGPPGVINRGVNLIRRILSGHVLPNPPPELPDELADLWTGYDDNRPITAPTVQVRVRDQELAGQFLNMRISENVSRNPNAIDESRVAAASRFQSDVTRQAAFLLNAMQDVESFEQNTDNERGVVIRDDSIPTNNLFSLQPCGEPPKPSEVIPFRSLFLTTLFNDWFVLNYLQNNDPYFVSIYDVKDTAVGEDMVEEVEGMEEEEDTGEGGRNLELCYDILNCDILNDDEILGIQRSPKSINDYTVSEILILWNASTELINGHCRGRNKRRAWLQHHPYPIGGKDSPVEDSNGDNLRKFYKCPNVILALYIHHIMKAYEENRLEAFPSQLGTEETGFHWIVYSQGGQTSPEYIYIKGVGQIIGAIRLAGFANSVVLGYHSYISNDDGEYEVNDRTMPLGFEFMHKRAHTHHLLCFKSEHLNKNVSACDCITLVNHLACSDRFVNHMNEKCNGDQVIIFRDGDGKQVRSLHSDCVCCNHPANFSNAKCMFTSFREMYSEADKFEEVRCVQDKVSGERNRVLNRVSRISRVSQGDDVNTARTRGQTLNAVVSMRRPSSGNVDPFDAAPDWAVFSQHQDEFCLILFDLETSGRNPKTCRIFEYASIVLSGDSQDSPMVCISEYVNPGVEKDDFQMSLEAYEVNNITRRMLYGKRTTKEALVRMLEQWNAVRGQRKLCLIGHNVSGFDLRVLYHEAIRFGLQTQLRDMNIMYVDTQDVAKDNRVWDSIGFERPSSVSLGSLHETLFGEEIIGHHGALADVAANSRVLRELDSDLSLSFPDHLKSYNDLISELEKSGKRTHDELG